MKPNNNQQSGKAINKKDVQKKGTFPQSPGTVVVKYPLLWLALAAFIVYIPTLSFTFTELDDIIFIKEFSPYNEQWSNLTVSFQRGLFDAVKDPYFRPMFLDSIIFNYHLPGEGLEKYHLVNILLHISSVLLLYGMFIRLNVRKLPAFILSLVFAIHPVLSQAVAWIPGRNDTLLAVFTLSFFITAIDYFHFGRIKDLALATLMLLLAFFTKETAVFVPLVLVVMLALVMRQKLTSKNNIILLVACAACFITWYVVRAQSPNIKASEPQAGTMINDFIHRLPLIVQYIGKILLPVNQSVFPLQQDTSYLYGIAAIVIIAVGLALSKQANWRVVAGGAIIFILFLVPALLVPNNLNEQTFEHRLYLPMIGMLLLLSETVLFKKMADSSLLIAGAGICVVMAGANFIYQSNFKAAVPFWTQAVETSPHSAYAKMMLAAREDNVSDSYRLFRDAYKLDPNQKYINYYYGRMLQMQDSVLQSEPYLLREKKISDFYECDFYLARVAMTKGDTMSTISYLESYTQRNPTSEPAHSNLVLTYMSKRMYAAARKHMAKMRQLGVPVNPKFDEMINAALIIPPSPPPAATSKTK